MTFSILFHEMMHIFIAYIFGVKYFYLEITLLGGIVHFEYNTLDKKRKIVVLLFGVLGNILIVIGACLLKLYKDCYVFDCLIKYNLIMFVFSLLPIYPLDGYRLLKTLSVKQLILKILSFIFIFIGFIIGITNHSWGLIILFTFLLFKSLFETKEVEKELLLNYFNCYKSQIKV